MLKTMINGLVLYGLRRLKEPSTWSGLTLGLSLPHARGGVS